MIKYIKNWLNIKNAQRHSGENTICCFKVVNEKYLNNYYLHVGTARDYRKADVYEGIIARLRKESSKIEDIKRKYPNVVVEDDPNDSTSYSIFYFEETLNFPLYCFYSEKFKNCKPVFYSPTPSIKVEPPSNFFDHFSENSKFGLIWFKNNDKFNINLNSYLLGLNIQSKNSYIKYYKFNKKGEWIIPYLENLNDNIYIAPLFYKYEDYEIEKEYRYVFTNYNKNEINDKKISLEDLVENRCTSNGSMLFKISINLYKEK